MESLLDPEVGTDMLGQHSDNLLESSGSSVREHITT